VFNHNGASFIQINSFFAFSSEKKYMRDLFLFLLTVGCCRASVLPVLDWDGLFSSVSVFKDNVYIGEFHCLGNSSGLKSFLVFDIPLSNPYSESIQLLTLPFLDLFLYNDSILIANNSVQLAYIRDEFCPSLQPGYDHVFYKGISPECRVILPKAIPCLWLDVTELVNSTGPLELSVIYNSEERNYTFDLSLLKHRFRDLEFDWLSFSAVVGLALIIVFMP